jgi:hypothetical protein
VSNTSPQHIAANTGAIFAQLNQQDVEEFYICYQYWNLQHQIEGLQTRLDYFHKQIIVNTERIQEEQPTAIELATLARLQSNGVSDVDLLDRMLEQGESWLDRTMQRLDYLEQLDDFISDDYTQWCQHALEGAYDWIDSVLDGNASSPPSTAVTPLTSTTTATTATTQDINEEGLIEATEELFLQKISNDEDESLMQEITMKRPSITIADLEEAVPSSEDTCAAVEVAPTPENTTPENANLVLEQSPIHEEITLDSNEDTKTSSIEEAAHTKCAASGEPLSVESSSTSTNEQLPMQEPVEISPAKISSSSQTKSTHVHVSPERPNFMKRFFGKIWGS